VSVCRCCDEQEFYKDQDLNEQSTHGCIVVIKRGTVSSTLVSRDMWHVACDVWRVVCECGECIVRHETIAGQANQQAEAGRGNGSLQVSDRIRAAPAPAPSTIVRLQDIGSSEALGASCCYVVEEFNM
jgi:hypothetical protein